MYLSFGSPSLGSQFQKKQSAILGVCGSSWRGTGMPRVQVTREHLLWGPECRQAPWVRQPVTKSNTVTWQVEKTIPKASPFPAGLLWAEQSRVRDSLSGEGELSLYYIIIMGHWHQEDFMNSEVGTLRPEVLGKLGNTESNNCEKDLSHTGEIDDKLFFLYEFLRRVCAYRTGMIG